MIKLTATIEHGYTTLINVDEKNLLSFKCSFMSVSDISKPSYGIISNEGSLDLIDTDGEIFRLYKERNSRLRNSTIRVYISNDLTNFSENIGTFYSVDWSYDEYEKKSTISFRDDIIKWQDVEIDAVKEIEAEKSAFEIYEYAKSKTPTTFSFSLDENTEKYLKSYKIVFPFIDEGTLWSLWDKICQACALHIYKNKSNKVVVVHRF